MKIKKNALKSTLKNNKSIINSFSYLSALQLINLLIPLATYPYLIRVVGKEAFGSVVFAQAVVNYLVIFVGFGFNLSATRLVSINRQDKQKLSEIISSVFILKGILLLIAFVTLALLLLYVPKAKGYEVLFLVSMWACIYDVIYPIWYYQGLEKMQYITIITLISRIVFVILIFICIHQPSDFLLIPIIYGIGAIIAGVISLYIVFFSHAIKFKWQRSETLWYYLLDSIPIFISNISIILYVNTNKVITGTFLGMTEVAYYDLAEKITTLLKMPINILGQSIFPRVSKEKNLLFVKKIFKISTFSNGIIVIIALLLSKSFILILGGHQMLPSQPTIIILMLTIPFIAMSNIFGIQILIPFGYNKLYTSIIVFSCLTYVMFIGSFWIFSGITLVNLSIATLLTEISVTLLMFYFCKKKYLW